MDSRFVHCKKWSVYDILYMVCKCRRNRHTNNSVYDTLWVVMVWQHTKTFSVHATPSYTP